jgi:hypothetical protein
VPRGGRRRDAPGDAREDGLIALEERAHVCHPERVEGLSSSKGDVRRQRELAVRFEQRGNVDAVVETNDSRPVGEHSDDRRAVLADEEARTGTQLSTGPNERQPFACVRIERPRRERPQQQHFGDGAAFAASVQARPHHPRLVDDQNVACAQHVGKRRERAVLERSVRPDDEQARRIALRCRFVRDQRFGQRVVVGRNIARPVLAFRYEVGTRWRSISRNDCSRRRSSSSMSTKSTPHWNVSRSNARIQRTSPRTISFG